METFSALLAICAGNSPVNGEFPAQRPVTLSFDLICACINGWVSEGEAGDFKRYRANYDVIVMSWASYISVTTIIMDDDATHLPWSLTKKNNFGKWNERCARKNIDAQEFRIIS